MGKTQAAPKGISYERTPSGKIKKIIFDAKLHGEALQDYIDGLRMEAMKDEPSFDLDEVLEEEFKRRGLQRPGMNSDDGASKE